NNTFSNLSPGTYTITVIDAGGCIEITTVSFAERPNPTVLVTDPAQVCEPATIDITNSTVTAGSDNGLVFTYWLDASATVNYPTPDVATNGTYYIKGLAANGCYIIMPVKVIVNKLPDLKITNPEPVCPPATVNLTS